MRTALFPFVFAMTIAAGTAAAADFTLSSGDIGADKSLTNTQVLNGFGCTGGNQSPALKWDNPPAGTKSFVLTAFDPDAPTGSGWWHWVVFNLPADTRELASGASSAASLPTGAIQSRTDFGTLKYGGVCPPPGETHHYIFKVTALKVDKLDLDSNASAALVGYMTHVNSLGSAELVATYGR